MMLIMKSSYGLVAVFICVMLIMSIFAACGDGADNNSSVGGVESDVSSAPAESVENTSSETVNSFENSASTVASLETVTSSTDASSTTASSSSAASSSASSSAEPVQTDRIQILGSIGGNGSLYKFNDNIYKLEIPFSGIYTSAFFIKLDDGSYCIIDTGSNSGDVANYVVPAAKTLGVNLYKVKGIMLTHTHGDHTGGLSALVTECPNATVYGVNGSNANVGANTYRQVSDGTQLMNVLKAVTIKGHDTDACGYLDTRTNTLIAGDSLQLHGIASWGCQVRDVKAYLESMKKLQGMAIDNIFVAHAYVPTGAYAIGAAAVQKYIQDSIDCLNTLIEFTVDLYKAGVTDSNEIQKQYIAVMKETEPNFPKSGFDTAINAIIRAYC